MLAHDAACAQTLNAGLGITHGAQTTALDERIRDGQQALEPNSAVPNSNLPAALTPFVGRATELDTLQALTETPRI